MKMLSSMPRIVSINLPLLPTFLHGIMENGLRLTVLFGHEFKIMAPVTAAVEKVPNSAAKKRALPTGSHTTLTHITANKKSWKRVCYYYDPENVEDLRKCPLHEETPSCVLRPCDTDTTSHAMSSTDPPAIEAQQC